MQDETGISHGELKLREPFRFLPRGGGAEKLNSVVC